jgi:hypothetical protein
MHVFDRAIVAASLLVMTAGGASPALADQPVTAPAPEVLTNETVIKLIDAGIPEQAIIGKIRTSATNFDMSTDQLIALKAKGVSGPVLAAMLDPKPPAAAPVPEFSADSPDLSVPHYPGVYILDPRQKKMWRITPTSSNQAKTNNLLGYALTLGLAPLSVKASIPGKSAKVQTNDKFPEFYFFFDESVPRALQGSGSSLWTTGAGSITSSPSELSLVRFAQKPSTREAKVGTVSIAGAKQGVMDSDQIPFEAKEVRPGVFKVSVSAALQPGEYGFIQALTGGNVSGGGGAMTARVFDFGIVTGPPLAAAGQPGGPAKETPWE